MPGRWLAHMSSERRQFLRVDDFDRMQNPKRPKRPTRIKSFVRDLDDPDHLCLTLTVRGFLSDFQKLAASMQNRVPNDVRFIARKINTPPTVAGQALNTCLTHGLVTRFDEDMKTSRNNDIKQRIDARLIPPSLSSFSNSKSPSSTYIPNRTTDTDTDPENKPMCAHCDGEGCAWCRKRHIPITGAKQ